MLTLDELGVSATDAVYVGDTCVDVNTARNAGMPIIGVSWGYKAAAPMPRNQLHALIDEPRELLIWG